MLPPSLVNLTVAMLANRLLAVPFFRALISRTPLFAVVEASASMNILTRWLIALGPVRDDTVAAWHRLRDVGRVVRGAVVLPPTPRVFWSPSDRELFEAATCTVLPRLLNQTLLLDALLALLSSPSQHVVLKALQCLHNGFEALTTRVANRLRRQLLLPPPDGTGVGTHLMLHYSHDVRKFFATLLTFRIMQGRGWLVETAPKHQASLVTGRVDGDFLEWDVAAIARELSRAGASTEDSSHMGVAFLSSATTGWDLFRYVDSCARVSLSLGVHPLPPCAPLPSGAESGSTLGSAGSAGDVLLAASPPAAPPAMTINHRAMRARSWSADLTGEQTDRASREARPDGDSKCPRALALIAAMLRELLRCGILLAVPAQGGAGAGAGGGSEGAQRAHPCGDADDELFETPTKQRPETYRPGPPPPTPVGTPMVPCADVDDDGRGAALFLSPAPHAAPQQCAAPLAAPSPSPLVDCERSSLLELLEGEYIWEQGCDTFALETVALPFRWPARAPPTGAGEEGELSPRPTVVRRDGQDKATVMARAARSSAVATAIFLREAVARDGAKCMGDIERETAAAALRLGAAPSPPRSDATKAPSARLHPRACGDSASVPTDGDVRRFACAAVRVVRRRAMRRNRAWVAARRSDLEMLKSAGAHACNEAATVTLNEKKASIVVQLKQNTMMLSDAAAGYLAALARSDAQTMGAYGGGDVGGSARATTILSAHDAALSAERDFFAAIGPSPFGAGGGYDHEALSALCTAFGQMETVLALRRACAKKCSSREERREADVRLSRHRTHNAGHIVPSLAYTVMVHTSEGKGETAVCHEREDL
jgi:hypothetical protein